jgi:hypothetical protein
MSQWITLEEARANAHSNIAWWKCEDQSGWHVEENQYDPKGPSDKPVYVYANGDMYLGEWKKYGNFLQRKSRPGCFGVYLSRGDCVFVGLWKKGKLNGACKMLWLPSSPTWSYNQDLESPIKVKNAGVPFLYIGRYEDGQKNDPSATVILRNGMARVGPWKDDAPVGDWWNDHGLQSQPEIPPGQKIEVLLSFEGSGPQFGGAYSRATSIWKSKRINLSDSSTALIVCE